MKSEREAEKKKNSDENHSPNSLRKGTNINVSGSLSLCTRGVFPTFDAASSVSPLACGVARKDRERDAHARERFLYEIIIRRLAVASRRKEKQIDLRCTPLFSFLVSTHVVPFNVTNTQSTPPSTQKRRKRKSNRVQGEQKVLVFFATIS